MNPYELLALICRYVFDKTIHREKSAIMIAGQIVECVRIDRDFLIVKYPDK